jgi:hypothetical protein
MELLLCQVCIPLLLGIVEDFLSDAEECFKTTVKKTCFRFFKRDRIIHEISFEGSSNPNSQLPIPNSQFPTPKLLFPFSEKHLVFGHYF